MTGKCEKMRKPVEQSVLCRLGSPQIKSYLTIDQIHMRPVTVAIVTNKYVWLPGALPRKRTLTLVMKFVNFVSPMFKDVNSNDYSQCAVHFCSGLVLPRAPTSLSTVVSVGCVVLTSLIVCRGYMRTTGKHTGVWQ